MEKDKCYNDSTSMQPLPFYTLALLIVEGFPVVVLIFADISEKLKLLEMWA